MMVKQLSQKLMIVVAALFFCVATDVFSQDNDNRPAPTPKVTKKTFKLQIEVTTSDSSEKLSGQAVELTSLEGGVRFSKKASTNRNGIATFSQVPEGRLRIQIVVKQFDTFGQDYNLTNDNETIKISLRKQGTGTMD